jgi:hypothetical protein
MQEGPSKGRIQHQALVICPEACTASVSQSFHYPPSSLRSQCGISLQEPKLVRA